MVRLAHDARLGRAGLCLVRSSDKPPDSSPLLFEPYLPAPDGGTSLRAPLAPPRRRGSIMLARTNAPVRSGAAKKYLDNALGGKSARNYVEDERAEAARSSRASCASRTI